MKIKTRKKKKDKKILSRFLNFVERAGNRFGYCINATLYHCFLFGLVRFTGYMDGAGNTCGSRGTHSFASITIP